MDQIINRVDGEEAVMGDQGIGDEPDQPDQDEGRAEQDRDGFGVQRGKFPSRFNFWRMAIILGPVFETAIRRRSDCLPFRPDGRARLSVGADREAEYETLGIMATKAAMESKMYGRLPTPDILRPSDEFLDQVHQCYVDMATVGAVTEAQRQVFFECGRDLCERQGAEAVLLGGTDLFLAFDGRDCGFEVIDCALLHIEDLASEAARQPGSPD